MCGIVGHIGTINSVDVLLNGLGRLEYRGYDSAGICIKDKDNKLSIHKKIGKIQNLKEYIKDKELVSHIGIGHTRWATHGGVTDENAHPHGNEKVALIVNGIVEDYAKHRKNFINLGHKFLSETDTEVYLALVTEEYEKTGDLIGAVSKAFKRIEGNLAAVVMCREKEQIVAIKKGAPLVCGEKKSNNEVFVSSDPYALVGYADQLFFPEDEVICVLEKDQPIKFLELNGEESQRYVSMAQLMNLDISDKGNFEHFMLKEIFEQPERVRQFIDHYFSAEGLKQLKEASEFKPERIHIAACGTAWHAGLVIRNFIEKYNKIPCHVELASEFRYRDPIVSKKDLGLFISQSGETADTLAALDLCKSEGLKSINIGNVVGSTQFRSCDFNLLIKAGVEIGVASTKAFTQMGLMGHLYSRALNGDLFKDEKRNEVFNEMTLFASRLDELLKNVESIKKIAQEIYHKKGFLFTGRGVYFPITLEGALKLKEIAYVHAEGYAGGELKHGPIALIDEEMVNVAITGPELMQKMISNIEEVKARRGIIVVIGPENSWELKNLGQYYIPLNFDGLDNLGPLLANVVCQLLSYYMANFKGTDIDKPRNLAKSVTVE